MYTVQSGDTLASIASALWGDASLWWKLAEVNGLTAESVLAEGQPLIIPERVTHTSRIPLIVTARIQQVVGRQR